jgi:deoxycytidine triphosphate deaminase
MSRTAAEKYEAYKEKDPFPDIDAALLNSADIQDYVNTTGMVDPFYEKDLKSGSYEAKIKGICKEWDENGKDKETFLRKEHDIFELKPNSIAFIEVEPKFRLPNYIALRFNLKIKNVYRGLLLGTGPLIDPGYEGKIYIPLHNLTSNTYRFEYGEGLIWVEFTKISKIRGAAASSVSITREGVYKPFPDKKKNKPLQYFLNQAKKGGSIASSIPPAIEEAKLSADKAKKSLKNVYRISVVAFIAIIVGIVALAIPVYQLQNTYINDLNNLRKDSALQEKRYSQIERGLTDASDRLLSEIKIQERKIAKLQAKLEHLSSVISSKTIDTEQANGVQGVQKEQTE